MKYYASVNNKDQFNHVTVQPPWYVLVSYFYFKNNVDFVKAGIEKHYDIFVDCGAFSAENSGKDINIDEYCQFIIDTGATTYAGLDVIGDAKASAKNIEYMRKEYGLKPIPTFHLGSTLDDLAELVHGEYSYIALGGLVFSSNVMKHCDQVWHYILSHNPKLRVHGFGITNAELMARYPWYSVDSSSWTGCERFGRQQVLWDDFNFRYFDEDEYIQILRSMGHTVPDKVFVEKGMSKEQRDQIRENNRILVFLYRFYSVQSFKLYGAYLKEINKHKKFDWLSAQGKLFT